MYGLKPTDIDSLAHLRGAEITQICVGPYDIQFNFHPKGNIAVQGRCELVGQSGAVVEVWEGNSRPGQFLFPNLLMTAVVDVSIDPPKSLLLTFANGMALRVIDNLEQYESFQIDGLIV